MPDNTNGKIAEITPEIAQGFGTKYQPEDFTPSALLTLLTEASKAEDAPEPPSLDTPPEVPVQPEKPETPPTPTEPEPLEKDERKPLRKELYETKNQLNTIQQKYASTQKLLERFRTDPDEMLKWAAKERGESVQDAAKRFHREADGTIDLGDVRNQDALTKTALEMSKELPTLREELEALKSQLAQRDQLETQKRELGHLDEMLESYGVTETLGERFSEAEGKYAQVYHALATQAADGSVDDSKVDRFISDPAFRAQYPSLSLPKNMDAYLRVRESQRLAQSSPVFDLGTLLKSAGITGQKVAPPAVTPESVDSRRALEKQLANQDKPILPPGNPPMQALNTSETVEAFIMEMNAKEPARWTPEERAKMLAIMQATR